MFLEIFTQKGKVGFKNGSKIKLPAIYESASYFHDGYAVVRLNEFSGVIDTEGNFVIPNRYSDVTYLFGDYYCIRINIGDDWNCGVIDIEGNTIIEPSFKHIIQKDEKFFLCYNIANSKMNMYSYKVYEYDSLGECEWYDIEGNFLTSLEVVNSSSLLVVKNDKGKMGVINLSGKLVIDCIYDTIEPCCDDAFSVSIVTEDVLSCFVINSDGIIVLPSKNGFYRFKNGFFYEYGDNKNTIWYSITGKLVFDGEAKPLSTNFIAVYNNYRWGIINKNGEKIINYLYDEIVLLNNCFVVLREGKIGLIDLNGRIIVDAIYNSIECVTIDNNPYKLGDKEKLIRNSGSINKYVGFCLECVYDTNKDSDCCKSNYDCIIRNVIKVSKYYGNSISSLTITPLIEFDISKPLILSTDESQELYLKDRGIIPNGQFSKIDQITPICFVVKRERFYGVYRIDIDSVIIPLEYDQIQFMGGHTVLLCKDGFWGAQDLLPDDNILKSLSATVSIPCENIELKFMDSFQLLYSAKKHYSISDDDDMTYYTILDRNGQETKNINGVYLDTQLKLYDLKHILSSKNGKSGFVTVVGFISVPFIYDEITERKGGNFNVRIDTSWGVIDINGRELMPVKYAQPIPLYITQPEDVLLEEDDFIEYDNRISRIITNGSLLNHFQYINPNYDEVIIYDSDGRMITNKKGLTILEDGRSGFLGCVDLNGKEVLPTVFEHLMFSENEKILYFGLGGCHEEKYCSFFSNIEYANWGCIGINGNIMIEARYDCFKYIDGYILGGRDGSMLGKGFYGQNYYESEYGGVYDMYDVEGNLLIGGFREFKLLKSQNLYLFKFGGYWVEDEDDYHCHSYYFEKGNSRWLAVDKDFNSIKLEDNGKRKSFYHHIGNMNEFDDTNYWNIPLKYFSIDEPYIENDVMICGCLDDFEQYAVRISDGLSSFVYDRIEMIDDNIFFFTMFDHNVDFVGIASLSKDEDIILIDPENEETYILTYPKDGFVFGVSKIDESNCKVVLYNIKEVGFNPIIAISKVNEHDLFEMIKQGLLQIFIIDSKVGLQRISVIKRDIFEDSFQSLINITESVQKKDSTELYYWYSQEKELSNTEEQDEFDYQNYENETDYRRDNWDAMTDGMYGDMPDGFDGDYSFLGH